MVDDNGQLEWDDPIEEVNKWVAELKATYDHSTLEEEAKRLGGAIDIKSFQHFYTKK